MQPKGIRQICIYAHVYIYIYTCMYRSMDVGVSRGESGNMLVIFPYSSHIPKVPKGRDLSGNPTQEVLQYRSPIRVYAK